MAKLIKANGEIRDVKPLNGKEFEIEEIQSLVGGYVEYVPAAKRGYVLAVNEDGKPIGLPFNSKATMLAFIYADYIAGDAVYCKREEVDY